MKGGLFSTRNDKGIALVYMLFVIILIFSLEVAALQETPFSSSTTGPLGTDPTTTFEMQTVEMVNEPGHTNEGGYSESGFTLTQAVIEHISLELTWSDDYGNNDLFRVSLSFKGTILKSQEGETGTITFDISTIDMDEPQGDYTIAIEAVDCPGAVGGLPIDRDEGNDWSLLVTARVSVEITGE